MENIPKQKIKNDKFKIAVFRRKGVRSLYSVRRAAHRSGGLKSHWVRGHESISKSGGNSSLAGKESGGQGVDREVESEGFEENHQVAINGGHPDDELVGQRWRMVESAL